MSINLNQSLPAAPAGTVNAAWQVDGSGNVSANVPDSASKNASVNATAQTANIGATTLFTPAAGGLFRISGTIIVTSVGTTSTLPKITLTWTDSDNSTGQSLDVTATLSTNALTTFAQFTAVIDAVTSGAVQYATSGYASTGSAMAYAIRLRSESL
jgi:hypothetical protein